MEDGLFFGDSPGEKEALENAKRERRRCKIIKELFETEKTYLQHLELVHKFYFFPLRFNCIVPEDVHSRLFSNIEQIKDVNRTLLELMEQSTVGQAFRHLGPFLKLYATYANNHEQALTVLQEWTQKSTEFAEFISTQEARPEGKGLKINALLITPVQRIPRYKLLLEDLLENTPRNHHDYLHLKEATLQIGEIARHINEHIRQHENFQKMLSIQKSFDSSAPKILQPGRLFLKEGPLRKVSRSGAKSHERMFFLFNDMLLYGKPKLLESGGRSYSCCCVLPIKHCFLENVLVTNTKESERSGGGVFKNNPGRCFTWNVFARKKFVKQRSEITCKEESLTLYSDDINTAKSWSDAIDKAIRKVNEDYQTLRKPSSHKIPLRGRSLRKHRQQEKKIKIQTTPVRREHEFEAQTDSSCCSPNVRKHLDPVRYRIQSVYDNLPFNCASPTTTKIDQSVMFNISEVSSDASGSRPTSMVMADHKENSEIFTIADDLPMCTEMSESNLSVFSTGSTVPMTCTKIYYPQGSLLSLNVAQSHGSVKQRLKSYLRRPFTRLQRAKQDMSRRCSPFTQRSSDGFSAAPTRRK